MVNESEMLKQIGSRIRAARNNLKMSQEELSEKADLAFGNMSDIELGKTCMRLTTFIRIIEALNVSADEIIRADVSKVNVLYQNEFAELLNDCTPKQIETIITLVKNVKDTFNKI